MAQLDQTLAAAESALERIPTNGSSPADQGDMGAQLDLVESVGLHVESDQHPDLGREDERDRELFSEVHPDPDRLVCVDAFVEAFNARDLDALLELVSGDCETPGLAGDLDDFALAIEDLWHRRPTCLLTRGEHADELMGVLWELADEGSWWRVATVHVDDVADGRFGVVEFCDDPVLVDEVLADVPDLDLEEGSRWHEWSDGSDGP